MNPIIVHPLSVFGIYYPWRIYAKYVIERQETLRERVTYLLWNVAQHCC